MATVASVTSSVTPSCPKQTQNQRYKLLQEISADIANVGSLATGEIFDQRTELLRKILSAWSSNIEITLDPNLNMILNDLKKNSIDSDNILMPDKVIIRGRPKGLGTCTTQRKKSDNIKNKSK